MTFREAIRRKDFVVTAEPPLHPALTLSALEAEFETLGAVVDAVQIGDNEEAEGHIAPLAVASIAQRCGVDPVVHLSCRDRNRIALQSEILGAAAIGADSLLMKRGNKLPSALRGRVKSVFDSRATQLLSMAVRLADGSGLAGAQGFYLGTYVTVVDTGRDLAGEKLPGDDSSGRASSKQDSSRQDSSKQDFPGQDWTGSRVIEKIDAGANFLQTRPGLNMDGIARYAERLVGLRIPHRASFIVGIPLLTSVADARSLIDRFPDTKIPDDIMQRLARANDNIEGINILTESLVTLSQIPGVTGANVFYLRNADADAVTQAITRAGLS